MEGPAQAEAPTKAPKSDWRNAMAAKLASEQGRALYKLRQQTVEPVFGIIKSVLGFLQFLLRGLDHVRGEWNLVTMAWNLKRMFALIPAT